MSRYMSTKTKFSNIRRGNDIPTTYNNVKNLSSTIYNSVPETDGDLYVMTQEGDRLDLLAQQFYGDVNLWWYIAKANNLTFMSIPHGTSLRIPATTEYAIGL